MRQGRSNPSLIQYGVEKVQKQAAANLVPSPSFSLLLVPLNKDRRVFI